MTQPKPTNEPWYRKKDFYVDKAEKYREAIQSTLSSQLDSLASKEIISYWNYSLVKLIFESNRMESAGLPEGETKSLIAQFPEISISTIINFNADQYTPERLKILSKKGIVAGLRFKKHSRSALEVLRHYKAISHITEYILSLGKRREAGESVSLFTEEIIKSTHAILAESLLPAGSLVESGQYRIDERSINGVDLKLISPALVAPAMAKLVADSNALVRSNMNPWEVAARISYDFAYIHPFPDFNGRVSRLLLVLTLFAKGVGFFVTVRGDKKGKARYLLALRHANRGNLDSYITLIAMAMVQAGEQVDANLKRAGLPGLLESGA